MADYFASGNRWEPTPASVSTPRRPARRPLRWQGGAVPTPRPAPRRRLRWQEVASVSFAVALVTGMASHGLGLVDDYGRSSLPGFERHDSDSDDAGSGGIGDRDAREKHRNVPQDSTPAFDSTGEDEDG